MVMILIGHVDTIQVGSLDTTGFAGPFGLFPFYTYHVASFAFISGYFTKSMGISEYPGYMWKRTKRLLLPTLIINLLYGLLCVQLYRHGFYYDDDHTNATLSFHTLVVAPFTDGHQFNFNYTMWFIPSLYFAQLAYVMLSIVLDRMPLKSFVLLAVSLLIGAVSISVGGAEGLGPSLLLLAVRSGFLLCFMGIGSFFHTNVERHTRGHETLICLLACLTQMLVFYLCQGNPTYIPSWGRFPHGIALTLLTTLCGIAFWLSIAKLVAPSVANLKFVRLIADNTYSLMLHHRLGYYLTCLMFGIVSLYTPLNHGFDWVEFKSSTAYRFYPLEIRQFAFVYLLGTIVISLAIHQLWVLLKSLVCGRPKGTHEGRGRHVARA